MNSNELTNKIIEDSDNEGIKASWDEHEEPYYVKKSGSDIIIMSGLGHEIIIGAVGAMELAENIIATAEEILEQADLDEDRPDVVCGNTHTLRNG